MRYSIENEGNCLSLFYYSRAFWPYIFIYLVYIFAGILPYKAPLSSAGVGVGVRVRIRMQVRVGFWAY